MANCFKLSILLTSVVMNTTLPPPSAPQQLWALALRPRNASDPLQDLKSILAELEFATSSTKLLKHDLSTAKDTIAHLERQLDLGAISDHDLRESSTKHGKLAVKLLVEKGDLNFKLREYERDICAHAKRNVELSKSLGLFTSWNNDLQGRIDRLTADRQNECSLENVQKLIDRHMYEGERPGCEL